jgi:hypothetical protein
MLFGPRATALEVSGCEIPEIIAHDTPEGHRVVHAAQDRHPGCQDHYGCGKALAQDFATLICLHLLGPAVVPSYVVCVEAAGFFKR